MEITNTYKSPITVNFSDLKPGDCFSYNGQNFLRIENDPNASIVDNALCLSTFKQRYFAKDSSVVKLYSKLKLSENPIFEITYDKPVPYVNPWPTIQEPYILPDSTSKFFCTGAYKHDHSLEARNSTEAV